MKKVMLMLLAVGAFSFAGLSCESKTENAQEEHAESSEEALEEGADEVEDQAEEMGDRAEEVGEDVDSTVTGDR